MLSDSGLSIIRELKDFFNNRAFVIIFEPQFDRVIGLQFFMSFPSFERNIITKLLCDAVNTQLLQLCFQEFNIKGPATLHSFFYVLYGMPSGPGAESAHVFST
jgi:hypothetical protein